MAKCVHCGKAAGLFRSHHAACREQYDTALKTIPAFFEKVVRSTLPAERFVELLREAAAATHVNPDQLRSLATTGVNVMVDSVLDDHVVTEAEEDRIIEIAETIGLPLDAVPGLEDKLIKSAILRELEAGQTPDRVEVVGPMPLELQSGETIIWIFNNAGRYRAPRQRSNAALLPSPKGALPDYYSPSMLSQIGGIADAMSQDGAGDLVVTTEHLVMIWGDRERSVPHSKVSDFYAYRDGLQIRRGAEGRTYGFAVDDPWFANNLIVRLLPDAARGARPSTEDVQPDHPSV